MPSHKHCEDKRLLLADYNQSTKIYATAVSDLTAKMGVVSKDEYIRLHDFAEACRGDCGIVRNRLEHHIAEHGC